MKRWPIIVASLAGAIVGFLCVVYVGMAFGLATSLTTTAVYGGRAFGIARWRKAHKAAKQGLSEKFVAVHRELVYKKQFSVSAECIAFCLGQIRLKPFISTVSGRIDGARGVCSLTYAFTSHIFGPFTAAGAAGDCCQSGPCF